jgi:hypothetical protein
MTKLRREARQRLRNMMQHAHEAGVSYTSMEQLAHELEHARAEFTVKWSIHVTATDHEDAAREAIAKYMGSNPDDTTYEVTNIDTRTTMHINLD